MSYDRPAVVFVNLGSPKEPTPKAVKQFLKEFLGDPRVIEVNPILWKIILNLIILPIRSPQSAKRYETIWTPEGSPLVVETEKLVGGMGQRLGKKFPGLFCTYAMRYGDPSIANVVRNLHLEKGFQKILLVPLNPQYSATTTGSVMDALCDVLKTMRSQPEIRVVRDFHNEDAYIEALAKSISDFWKKHSPLGEKGKLVLSFHGMPQNYVNKGDPYQDQTVVESDLIANRLNLKSDQWVRTYQSRFGKDVWLQPYTEPTLVELAKQGTERIDIVCPSFITDCLETHEEIEGEARKAFLDAGGKGFNYIPCLNAQDYWLDLFSDFLGKHLNGWEEQP